MYKGNGKGDKKGFLGKLFSGISKSSSTFSRNMKLIIAGKKEIDEELFDEIEELLVSADVKAVTVARVMDQLKEDVKHHLLTDVEGFKYALKEYMVALINMPNEPIFAKKDEPTVIFFVGVNGAGKTTSIAKLANMLTKQGKSVLLAAGDTYRAAAIEQLEVWANRLNLPLVKQEQGSDAAAVVYDAVQHGMRVGADVVICDTAGRLHTKSNLMDELSKTTKVVKKLLPNAPHEVLLVIDGVTGMNALAQVKDFTKASGVTGVVLTKLDGTAKGGIAISIIEELGIPIKYVGFGETVNDLAQFDAESFIDALFDDNLV